MADIRVAVVGGGIAGLSAAAFLARAGITCAVYEQAAEVHEVGAGIQLSPNGSRLLHRAGLAGYLSRVAVRPVAIEVRRWRDNRTIARTELDRADYGVPYYTLHRADLHRGLLDLVSGTFRCGRRCVAVTEHPDRVDLRFADGSTESADLVLGADGLRSVVRRVLSTDRIRFSGLVAHRGLLRPGFDDRAGFNDRTGFDDRAGFDGQPRVLVWLGTDRHVVCYPIADGWINVVAVRPSAEPVELGQSLAEPVELGRAFADWPEPVPGLVREMDNGNPWPLYDRAPLARWCTRRVALLGDAAHPLLPFAAQGANQAIEDAATLAACLRSGLADVPGALARYERIRLPRLARVGRLVRDNIAVQNNIAVQDNTVDGSRPGRPGRAWLYGYDAEQIDECGKENDEYPADPALPDAYRG